MNYYEPTNVPNSVLLKRHNLPFLPHKVYSTIEVDGKLIHPEGKILSIRLDRHILVGCEDNGVSVFHVLSVTQDRRGYYNGSYDYEDISKAYQELFRRERLDLHDDQGGE